MPALHRLILLACALSGAGVFALLGAAYSGAGAPRIGMISGGAFWIATGTAVFCPLWLPALVPARHPRLLHACRRAGAIGCGVPLYLFGSSVVHQLEQLLFMPGRSAWGLVVAASVFAGCLIGAWVLWRAPPVVRWTASRVVR